MTSNHRRKPRWARHANGKTWSEHREDQVYYDDDGKARHQIGDQWVRAPELDAHPAHISTLQKSWWTFDGAIIIAA